MRGNKVIGEGEEEGSSSLSEQIIAMGVAAVTVWPLQSVSWQVNIKVSTNKKRLLRLATQLVRLDARNHRVKVHTKLLFVQFGWEVCNTSSEAEF